ncbi:MAG: hypothetical protein JJE27_05760 [Thermoleophilia bacterium]|nr:hypothetical protein [Thermoleophilia bacterium]
MPANTAPKKAPARKRTTARKAPVRKPTAASTQAKATATSAKTTARKAGAEAKPTVESYTEKGQAYAERAVLVPVGVVLEARDGIADFVQPFRTRTGLERKLKQFERRGKTFSNSLERDLRKRRTRAERELRKQRKEVENRLKDAQDRMQAQFDKAQEQFDKVQAQVEKRLEF